MPTTLLAALEGEAGDPVLGNTQGSGQTTVPLRTATAALGSSLAPSARHLSVL